MMYPPEKVAEIKRLVAEGHTANKVAAMARVSRSFVQNVIAGRRKENATRKLGRPASDKPPELATSSIAVRCPTCKALVYMPCVLCSIVLNPEPPVEQCATDNS